MRETVISWNFVNLFTIALMLLIIFALFAVGAKLTGKLQDMRGNE